MENEIKKRVKDAVKALEISVASIAKFRGLNERTVLDQINGNSKIGAATLESLLAYNPNISAEWLMRGDGEMFIVPTEGTSRDDQGATNEVVALLKKQIEQLEYIVELQKDRILQLEKECEDLKKANSTAATSHATTA